MAEGGKLGPEDAMTIRRAEASKAANQKIFEKKSQMGIGGYGLSNHTLSVWATGHQDQQHLGKYLPHFALITGLPISCMYVVLLYLS